MATPKAKAVLEQVGMRRWLRLTARKSSRIPQKAENATAAAAADALAMMLKEARKMS
jgi:hypothetical protein